MSTMQYAPGCVHFTENVHMLLSVRAVVGEPTIQVYITISYPPLHWGASKYS